MEEAFIVRELTVRYISQRYHADTLSGAIRRFFRGRHADALEVTALREVNLKLATGEVLGVIGPNGAGKSTLLKTLAGVIPPTSGTVHVAGRVAPLLELGAGFHPELTGEENVWLNAALLGLSRREIARRYDRILEFADLGDQIAVPVKSYSAGMFIRLAFAVATEVDADLVLADEVLAVGDLAFQAKSARRIDEMIDRGAAALIATHDLEEARRRCSRCVVLWGGEVAFVGEPDAAVSYYRERASGRSASAGGEPLGRRAAGVETEFAGAALIDIPGVQAEGDGPVRISKLVLLDGRGLETNSFRVAGSLTIRIEYEAASPVHDAVFGIALYSSGWTHVSGPNTRQAGVSLDLRPGAGVLEYRISGLSITPDRYFMGVSVFASDAATAYDHNRIFCRMVVTSDRPAPEGVVDLGGIWRPCD